MKEKVKIAILGDFPIGNVFKKFNYRAHFYPSWLFCLYEALATEDEFDVHWIVINKSIKTKEVLVSGNQTFHIIPGSKQITGLVTAYLHDRYAVYSCLKELNPDIFHAWGTERFYGLAAKDYKKGKTLLSVQGLLTAYIQRADFPRFFKLQSLYEPGVLKSVDYITTESPWARDCALKIAPHADITLWDYAVERSFYSITRNLQPSPCCLLACTHSKVKNVPLAVSAFSKPELQHIKLYMAGIRKEDYPDLPSNIIPLGPVDRARMADLLSETWCLVHPSLADTGPTILKEARVAGVAAVVTSECGAKQYVQHGKSGFIIPSHDEQALIDAVLQVTKSREIAAQMGAYQHDFCREALCEETMIANLKKIYHRILE